MNITDRRKMYAAARKFCSITAPALAEFSDTVNELKSREEAKLDNIPESLKDSQLAANIEESIDLLDSIQDNIETMQESFDSISDDTGINVSDFLHQGMNTVPGNHEPRSCRFQILLSESTMAMMRLRAAQTGISCNELVSRALLSELQKDHKA